MEYHFPDPGCEEGDCDDGEANETTLAAAPVGAVEDPLQGPAGGDLEAYGDEREQ